MHDAQIAIVGAGAAGLSLARELVATPGRAAPAPRILLLEPGGDRRPPPRTWCFWEADGGPYDRAVTASWRYLRVHDRSGRAVVRDIAPLRYKMLRSPDFERLVLAGLDRCASVGRLEARVRRVGSAAGGAQAWGEAPDGSRLAVRSRWLFDSRPPRRLPAARTTLLQHFSGWSVRTRRPVFDPAVADWMDFRTPQPEHGLSFGYVLPTGPSQALVEYTEFSRRPLSPEGYDAALRHYTRHVLRLPELEVTGAESGVIPMTDARFPRRAGASVFRIGTAGGATRPATGYTFAAVQRQSRAIAAALRDGRTPVPPPPYPARSRWMDAVLLHALDGATVDGADFFAGLFRTVPAERLLRFLDGSTRLHEDLSIGLRTPVPAMLGAAVRLPALPRRAADLPAHCGGRTRERAGDDPAA